MEITILVMFFINILMTIIVAIPTTSNSQEQSQQQQNDVNEEMITAYPDTQKQYVNLGNLSPQASNLIQKNKLDFEQIRAQQEKLRNKNVNSKNHFPTTTIPGPSSSKEEMESYRILGIQHALQATLRDGENANTILGPHIKRENPTFDFTFTPICELPRYMNISLWFQTNTWNILFKPAYHQYNIRNVMLRIFKVAKTDSESEECDRRPDMITLVISVYVRSQKMFKKKVIYQTMLDIKYNGWVEIDASGTLKYWNHQRSNYGLAVDLWQDDKQLDAHEYFHLQTCEAVPLIPWRAYEFVANQSGDLYADTITQQLQHMYTGPRLDITSGTPANYNLQSNEGNEGGRHQRHIRHENHHSSSQYSSSNSMEVDSYETFLRNRVHSNRDRLNRNNIKQLGEK